MTIETGLKTAQDEPISLKAVQINGRLNGLLLQVSTQQRYVNDSRRNVEVVYTFPLPPHAVILGVNLTIGGKQLSAVVLEKSQAQTDYEDAIAKGDMPVMVERSGPGLYTANLGNLKRNEEVLIEVQWAQLLKVRDSSIRIGIPTVIGQRYGDPHATGGLAPHETDEVNPAAQYPLQFTLTVEGQAADAEISCPSHGAVISKNESPLGANQTVCIDSNAYLDRDVVITLSKLPFSQLGIAQQNPDGSLTALASFCPEFTHAPSSIALKILVDCSGSMEGDSIEQAQEAVNQVMQQLQQGDYVSYSRFGSTVTHNFSEHESTLLPAEDRKLANLGRLIRSTKANMGGTEMQAALVSTINDLSLPANAEALALGQSILLITDGDIWNYEGVIRTARQSGHRIFAIGVGSAPAESLLQELAESTGGGFELVTPNEPMAQVALRMMRRVRSACAAQLTVNWGATPQWQSLLPHTVFTKESVHVFAQFETDKQALTGSPALTISVNGSTVVDTVRSIDRLPAADSVLARVAAAERLLSEPKKKALELAMQHSLVTSQTNLFLVHTRQSGDKAQGLPALEQIKQMAAAGHSGYGSASSQVLACYSQPTIWRDPRSQAASFAFKVHESGVEGLDIPAFLRKQVDNDQEPAINAVEILAAFNRIALNAADPEEAIELLWLEASSSALRMALAEIDEIVGDQYTAFAVFLHWLGVERNLGEASLHRHARRILQAAMAELEPEQLQECIELLETHVASRILCTA